MAQYPLKIQGTKTNAKIEDGALLVSFAGQLSYPEVQNFSALPTASSHTGEIYICLEGEGIYLVNRKSAGMYYSNGTSWSRLGNIPAYFSTLNLKIYDNTDNTKLLNFNLTGITTGNTRTLKALDTDMTPWSLNGAKAYYSAGNVGIGDSDPSYLLSVNGIIEVGGNFLLSGNTEAGLVFSLASGNAIMDIDARPSDGTSNSTIRFNQGVNTTGLCSTIFYNGDGTIQHRLDDSGSSTYLCRQGGQIGIGIINPTSILDVGGSIEIDSAFSYILGDPETNGSWRIRISGGGDLIFQKRVAGTWTTKDTIV